MAVPLAPVESFLEAMAAERGAARNTLLAYARDLQDFRDFAGAGFLAADRGMVEAWLSDMEARGLGKATRARRLSAVRQFFRFAQSEGWREDDPAARIAGPGAARRLPRTLSEAEAEALLTAARRVRGGSEAARASAVRTACLMELLYATGLRVSELCDLPVAAAKGDPRMILVRGKGGRERMVPLSPPAREALSAWLKVRGAQEAEAVKAGGRPSPWLFPSRGASGRLTRVRMWQMVRDLAVAAGIDPARVSPHTLRHAFATHLLANGADLRAIQQLLGHADLSTTEIYAHVLDARLRELVLTRHPLAG